MIEEQVGERAQAAQAERVSLGPTDIRISPLGIGTWSWGDSFYWGYGKGYDDSDIETAFQASVEAGINFYDTAEIYGQHRSERLLGKFAAASGQTLAIATKYAPFPWRLRRSNLLAALKQSLQRLGVAQVALYQIHWPMVPVLPEVWMEGMAEAVATGLTRAVGVSNYSAAWMRRCYATLARHGVPLASNQVRYSLLERAPERNGVFQACRDTGATLIAYSPLAMGVLTGKYTPENPPAGIRGRTYNRSYLGRVQPLIALLREIGDAHGKTTAQVSLNWTICKGAVPIPGAKNARQARENIGALGWRLDDGEVAALDAASDRVLREQ